MRKDVCVWLIYPRKNVSLHLKEVRKNVVMLHFYVRINVFERMERLVLQQFKEWKERKDRKPLIVSV